MTYPPPLFSAHQLSLKLCSTLCLVPAYECEGPAFPSSLFHVGHTKGGHQCCHIPSPCPSSDAETYLAARTHNVGDAPRSTIH